jgi:hypothetical protein
MSRRAEAARIVGLAVLLADLWAHAASCPVGFVGGMLLVVRTWRSRRQLPT